MDSPKTRPRFSWSRAFTIVELLVVITIMVVLLALLVPAMDRAVYQAELAVCATNQKAVISGVTVYAASNKRSYPDNPYLGGTTPHHLWRGGPWNMSFASRFSDYVDVNSTLNDPLTTDVDFENSISGTYVEADYFLWFGWQYSGEAGMLRLGGRWSYTSPSTPPLSHRFSFLVSDEDGVFGQQAAQASHPDVEGRMAEETYQDQPRRTALLGPFDAKYTSSYYWLAPGVRRGTIDEHHGYADGSVQRFVGVRVYDSAASSQDNDERMTQVPYLSTKASPEITANVPAP